MTYLENSLRVLMISSTSVSIWIAPVSAAGIHLTYRPGFALNLADLTTVAPNRSGLLKDGWIIDAGDCDNGGGVISPPEPDPGPGTEDDGNQVGEDSIDDVGTGPIITSISPPENFPSVPLALSNRTPAEVTPLIMVFCHDNNRTVPFGPDTTDDIVADLEEANVECGYIDSGFRIDCLAARYEKIALSLANTGDQAIVKSAFNSAARKLRRIVRKTVDPTIPKTRFALKTPDGGTKRISSRPLSAIKPSLQKQANAAAAIVIDELNTKLLRSSENSARRQEYFADIVMAVDSNKVLLRS